MTTPQKMTATPLSMRSVSSLLAPLVSRRQLPYLLALVAVENSHGADIYNNNLGNITVASETTPHWKASDGNHRMFGAYETPEQGATALVRRLGSVTHERMLEAAERDDVDGFVRAMTTPHPQSGMMYCDTCKPGPTLNTYRQLVKDFGGGKGKKSEGGFVLFLAICLTVAGAAVAASKASSD